MSLKNDYHKALRSYNKSLATVAKSVLIGLCAGLVTILYRMTLTKAEEISRSVYAYASHHTKWIILIFAALALLGWLVGLMVRKYPMISGSGIPQVKGQIRGYFKNPWISTLICKFIGGAAAIFAGLSLGREGPSIQLGATTAHGLSNRLAATRTERKILIAGGASAGLAAAFNAPLAGAMFALEEIFKYFSPMILLATITSAMTADFVAKIVFGLEPVFRFTLSDTIPLSLYWMIFILGIIVGISGAVYNYVLVKAIFIYKRIASINKHLKMVIPFLAAGVLGLLFPVVIGSGHYIVEALDASSCMQWLLLVLLLKFLFSMISFGSGAPGGIFFPLLVIGSLLGAIFGNAAILAAGLDPDLFYNFVVLAMAGFFTAIVRAPITGIILLTEMTGSFNHLLSLTVVSIVAYVTADLLKSMPIYDSLLKIQMQDNDIEHDEHDDYRKITIETVVHYGSPIENRCLKDLALPQGSLVIAIRRHGKDITPGGNTVIKAEDYLVILTSVKDEGRVRELVQEMTES